MEKVSSHRHQHDHSCFFCETIIENIQLMLDAAPLVAASIFLIGSLVLLKRLIQILGIFFRGVLETKRDLRKTGEICIITGATDGIGKAMAFEMVKTGLSLCLVGRNEDKLEMTKDELQKQGAKEVFTIAIDYAKDSPEQIMSKLTSFVNDKDIGVLINNVGASYPFAKFYDEVDVELIENIIDVNIRSTYLTTRAVYPGMVERRRGCIICIGSGASELPSDPLYCGYAGAKGAIEAFCRSLQEECASKNILVQCHVPLLITTKLSKIRHSSWMVPDERTYAKHAMKAIEYGSVWSHPTTSPYSVHRIILWASKAVPRLVWRKIRLSQVLDIRRKALKKQREEKKSE